MKPSKAPAAEPVPAPLQRRTHTPIQKAQYQRRAAVGALSMLPQRNPFGEELAASWERLMEERGRILDREAVLSIVRKLRTRSGAKRRPTWRQHQGHEGEAGSVCASIGGAWTLCGYFPVPTGAEHAGPDANAPLPEVVCPVCAARALVGGVLPNGEELAEGPTVTWSCVPKLRAGDIPVCAPYDGRHRGKPGRCEPDRGLASEVA